MFRPSAAAAFSVAFTLLSPCSLALASVEFSGRFALSTDSAGQRFLQVVIDEESEIQSLRRIEDSETRYNALLDTEWDFQLSGPHSIHLENRLHYGSALRGDRLNLGYQYRDTSGTRLILESETDLEEGKIFERDETDVRQSLTGRWSHPLGNAGNRLELYGRGELRRVEADTLFFPRSHNLGKAKVTWLGNIGVVGSFNLGYAVQGVAVVDSAPGSYVEHQLAGGIDFYAATSTYLDAQILAVRRDYVNSDSSSATGWGILSGCRVRYSPSFAWDLEARPSFELAVQDRPDFIYFDHHKLGLDLGLMFHPSDRSRLSLLPGTEILRAPDLEREDYDQFHVTLGADVVAPGIWLDLSYKVGRRDYASPAGRDDLESLPRSDYYFGDLLLLSEKALWGPLALTFTASHRIEWHELEEDDVTVFLLSGEVSYRF